MKNQQQKPQKEAPINQEIIKNLRRHSTNDLKISQSAPIILPKKNIVINGDMVIEEGKMVINGDLTVNGNIYVSTTLRTHDILINGKLTAKNIWLMGYIKAESIEVSENVWCWGLEVDKQINVKGSLNSFTEIKAPKIYANSVSAEFIYGKVNARKIVKYNLRNLII